MKIEPTDIAGIAGIIRHASTDGAGCARAIEAFDSGAIRELEQLGRRTAAQSDAATSAHLLASIRSSTSYAKGMKLELAAQRWTARHGIAAQRNTGIDLVLRDGTLLRPDFFAPGALDGALFLGEVKNRPVVSLTDQISDYTRIASANDVPLHLFVPRTTRLTSPLQQLVDAGDVVRINLGATRPG